MSGMVRRYSSFRAGTAKSAAVSALAVIVILIGLIFCTGLTYAGSIRVTPSRIEKDITRLFWIYNNRFGPIYVTNCGREKVKVRVYTGNLGQDVEGGAVFVDEADSFSIAEKIILEPREFILEPGATREVNGKIEIEKGRKGGGYAAIFFEAVPASESPDSVVVASRICVLLLASYPGERRIGGELVGIELVPGRGNGGHDLAIRYRNTGDIHIRPVGQVILTPVGRGGKPDIKRRIFINVGGERILPGFQRVLRIPLPLEEMSLKRGERILLELALSLGQKRGRGDYINAEITVDADGSFRLENITRPLDEDKKQ